MDELSWLQQNFPVELSNIQGCLLPLSRAVSLYLPFLTGPQALKCGCTDSNFHALHAAGNQRSCFLSSQYSEEFSTWVDVFFLMFGWSHHHFSLVFISLKRCLDSVVHPLRETGKECTVQMMGGHVWHRLCAAWFLDWSCWSCFNRMDLCNYVFFIILKPLINTLLSIQQYQKYMQQFKTICNLDSST